jgi:hypothetical protein
MEVDPAKETAIGMLGNVNIAEAGSIASVYPGLGALEGIDRRVDPPDQ